MTTTISGTNVSVLNVTFANHGSFDLAREGWEASGTFVLLTPEFACSGPTLDFDPSPTVLQSESEQEYHAWRLVLRHRSFILELIMPYI